MTPPRQRRAPRGATLLLFYSGLGGLVLEMSWLRELVLVFGSSTAATGVVLAVFMGGLGFGGWLLGRRADRHANPLRQYAWLLLLVAATAVPGPFLIDLGRQFYAWLGGQTTMGLVGATALRMLMSVVILGVPSLLMGGTLPAAARALTLTEDSNRRQVALLYGMNELGAVVGVGLSTFYSLEHWGIRVTLWSACAVYGLTSMAAFTLAGHIAPGEGQPGDDAPLSHDDRDSDTDNRAVPAPLLYVVAAIVGAVFLVMEMVWYRMLAPLLGGTTFTFGLILMVALAGIGIGGALYTLVLRRMRPTPRGLALTCAMEGVCTAIPFALGDRLAILAMHLRAQDAGGFVALAAGWAVVASVVVLPMAIVAGVQFPLLIALLGRGPRHIGRQVGAAVAWNTAGAVTGSLVGGFGLLPLLTAPGAWRAVVGVLALLTGVLVAYSPTRGQARGLRVLPGALAALALALVLAPGPSAAWRHSAIGAGRGRPVEWTFNALRDWMNAQNRCLVWEAEGIESSVAIKKGTSFAFYINGKCDGDAIVDANMQMMGGLIQALLHPLPRSSLVIGLGTGETAGWLAQVPQIERVDVVEIEPAVCEMARRCAAVNGAVLDNPKVHMIYNDGREVLLTSSRRYDLIFSEPSNPYRRGIASLYTREFYRAVRGRLNPGGLFMQWLQGYEIDLQSVRTVLATLRDAFAHVEVWRAGPEDLVMLCAAEPIEYHAAALRERVAQEPYRTALMDTWGVRGVEGFLSHYVAGPAIATVLHADPGVPINTDDLNILEYAFARTVGQQRAPVLEDLAIWAEDAGARRPTIADGGVDWDLVADYRNVEDLLAARRSLLPRHPTSTQSTRAVLFEALERNDPGAGVAYWEQHGYEVKVPLEYAALALAYAKLGSSKAAPLLDKLEMIHPVETSIIRSILAGRQHRPAESAQFLAAAYRGLRTRPWVLSPTLSNTFGQVAEMASQDPAGARALYESLSEPFAVYAYDEQRLWAKAVVAGSIGLRESVDSLKAFKDPVPWREPFLQLRCQVYEAAYDPEAPRARRDLEEFIRHAPPQAPGTTGAGLSGP